MLFGAVERALKFSDSTAVHVTSYRVLLYPLPLCPTPPGLPLTPFHEKVEMCFASMKLVNLLWVRLHCFSDPGPSLFNPQRGRLGRPGYHRPLTV